MSSTAKGLDELYPKTPWWTNLVAVVITAVAMLIFSKLSVGTVGAPTTGSLVTDTALFFPHALILFGILADMFTMEGVYSIPSLIGVLSLFLNKVMDLAWAGVFAIFNKAEAAFRTGNTPAAPARQAGGAVVNYPGCYLQGLEKVEFFKSTSSSQTLVVTSTILMYYLFDLGMNKGIGSAFVPLFASLIIYALQLSAMSSGGCFQQLDMTKAGIISLLNGVLIGGSAYAFMEAYAPNRLPSKVLSTIPKVNVSDLKVNEDGKLVDADGKAWNLLPDGTPVPDTCSASEDRDPNASGTAASNATCPGGAVTAR